jgi:NAD(P)-dependent dehydrogenase (short-subunit alcohol dehydrogenase family)
MRLKDKVALVTGSTRGIGEAIAHRFATEGASVVVTGRSTDDGERVQAAIREHGGQAAFVPMDISVEDDVKGAVEFAVSTFGRLTTLINNAAPSELVTPGIGVDRPIAELGAADFERILQVGLMGTVHAYRHALPALRDSGGGSVLTISSASAMQGTPGLPSYTAIKGALNALARQVAVDYAADQVRVNTLVVGYVMSGEIANTLDAHPEYGQALRDAHLTRIGRVDDVASAAVFFSSDEAEFITGASLAVDGGLTARINVPVLASPST